MTERVLDASALNALERLAGGYGSEGSRVQQDLALAEAQLRDYQARIGTPFPHEAYLAHLTALREQLKAILAGAVAEGESLPAASALAEQITALKATQAIVATPQRVGKRPSAAEVPVTARLRRHVEGVPPAAPPEASAANGPPRETPTPPEAPAPTLAEPLPLPVPAPDTGAACDLTNKRAATYQERVASGPRHKERQLTMF